MIAQLLPLLAATASLGALPAESLYQLDGKYEDQDGNRRALTDLAGPPTLFAMFYASCPKACPLLVNDIKRVLDALHPVEQQQIHVVLVSLDPTRDTPEVLRETMARRGLDRARWTLLRTTPEHTRGLASALGVRYRAQGDGTVDHTSKLVLLDQGGVIVTERDGLGGDLDAFVVSVRAHLKDHRVIATPRR